MQKTLLLFIFVVVFVVLGLSKSSSGSVQELKPDNPERGRLGLSKSSPEFVPELKPGNFKRGIRIGISFGRGTHMSDNLHSKAEFIECLAQSLAQKKYPIPKIPQFNSVEDTKEKREQIIRSRKKQWDYERELESEILNQFEARCFIVEDGKEFTFTFYTTPKGFQKSLKYDDFVFYIGEVYHEYSLEFRNYKNKATSILSLHNLVAANINARVIVLSSCFSKRLADILQTKSAKQTVIYSTATDDGFVIVAPLHLLKMLDGILSKNEIDMREINNEIVEIKERNRLAKHPHILIDKAEKYIMQKGLLEK